MIDTIVEQVDVETAVQRLGELLDESVVVLDPAEAFKARQFDAECKIVRRGCSWDLSQVNVDTLRQEFKKAPFKNIQIADLRAFLEHKLAQMLGQNATRTDFAQRLQKVIDAYNAGAAATENYYDELAAYAEALKAEAERQRRRAWPDRRTVTKPDSFRNLDGIPTRLECPSSRIDLQRRAGMIQRLSTSQRLPKSSTRLAMTVSTKKLIEASMKQTTPARNPTRA